MSACEWNPTEARPALSTDREHAPATLVVGADGQWHLCEGCAALPQFRRFTTRRPLPVRDAPERRQE